MIPPTRSKTTVLVVEDDRSLREMYRAALTVAGHTVAAVEDGIAACEASAGRGLRSMLATVGHCLPATLT